MKNVWYNLVDDELVIGEDPINPQPLKKIGLKSELEIKIMEEEIERGTFKWEEWTS